MMGGAMETVFWVIVAIVVLAVVYTCVLTLMKRKEALRRTLTTQLWLAARSFAVLHLGRQ
jgi:heme exporter protein D